MTGDGRSGPRPAVRVAVALAALAGLVWLELPSPPAGPPLEWRADLGQALSQAQAASRPAVLSFHATWCSVCRKLDHRTLRSPEVAAELERFVRVRIDASGRDRATEGLLRRFGVTGLPALVFVDSRGSIEPPRVLGFVEGERLLPVLRGIR